MSYKVRVTGIKHLYSRVDRVYLCTIFGGGLADLPNLTDMYEPQEVVIESEEKEGSIGMLGNPDIPQYEPPTSLTPTKTAILEDGYEGNYEVTRRYPNPMIHP